MNRVLLFLNNMDAKAWRTIWISLALFGAVGVLVVVGKSGVLGVSEEIEAYLEGLRQSPWALPATIGVFIATSFIAAPQFFLAGACVVAFGPWLGFGYALIGTIVSSALHFYMGRWGGAELVERYGGDALRRLSRFIGRNDFLASAIVRNVPTAPAIIVNMAFGASASNFWRFIAGVTVGSIPKIVVVSLLGQSFLSAIGGGVAIAIAAAAAVAGVWIAMALAARKAVRGDDAQTSAPAAGPVGEQNAAPPSGG